MIDKNISNMIKLVKGEPALIYNDWLVVSDLHLGIEEEYAVKGYSIPSELNFLLEKLLKFKQKKLIILGDIKHNISFCSEKDNTRLDYFFDKLKAKFKEIILIKGNHDATLDKKYNMKKEFWINDVVFIHGHTVSEKALNARKIIAGHMHPVYEFKNHLGLTQKYKCFIISKKIIILPAFTNLSPGASELVKPLNKYIEDHEVLLLDHTKVV